MSFVNNQFQQQPSQQYVMTRSEVNGATIAVVPASNVHNGIMKHNNGATFKMHKLSTRTASAPVGVSMENGVIVYPKDHPMGQKLSAMERAKQLREEAEAIEFDDAVEKMRIEDPAKAEQMIADRLQNQMQMDLAKQKQVALPEVNGDPDPVSLLPRAEQRKRGRPPKELVAA